MKYLKQMFCVHWFDNEVLEREVAMGNIINLERKTFNVKYEKRTCSKCELSETRQTGEPEFLGWF